MWFQKRSPLRPPSETSRSVLRDLPLERMSKLGGHVFLVLLQVGLVMRNSGEMAEGQVRSGRNMMEQLLLGGGGHRS